ncbi:MAG TPA: glycosyltransferase family 39 protein [Vicinamibacterales bacterium]|nr:glycosyltransferase family 39 protein [Vicinamibacterales bacterium]
MKREVNLAPRPRAFWGEHWPALCVFALAAALLFVRLGADYLWADEGDTAVLARNILRSGVPTAWDGVTFTDSDFGSRVNDDLVMVSHPWLPYYLTAGSFALFGESPWSARLPFALCGLATIAVVYAMVFGVTRRRWTAASAALLLTLSVQFLLYARQSRHYTLHALLACLLIWQFTRLNSWKRSALFAAFAVLLFHSHPLGIAPMVGLGVLTLLDPAFRPQRPWFWRAVPIVLALTLPWAWLAQGGYVANSKLTGDLMVLAFRAGQFLIECASVTAVLGAAAMFLVTRWKNSSPATSERTLILPILAAMTAYILAIALTQGRDEIFSMGVRYAPAVIPFVAIINGILIARVSQGRRYLAVTLLILLGLTKLGRLTPWTFWEAPSAKRDSSAAVSFHNPERPIDRVLRTGQYGFLQSLVRNEPGTMGQIVEFLKAHASPRDVVVTNYAWEPLYFHTGLPQGLTVLSSYPIYQSAKAHGLPDYVFRADDARWIVWRQAWGRYRGQALDRVIAQLGEERVPVTLMARIPETLWENRENLHFRRFPGNRYIYPWYGSLPDALIYRVGS